MNYNTIAILSATLGYGTFTLSHGGRYLRVNATHAWLGTKPQVFSEYAGYGDGQCGGPAPCTSAFASRACSAQCGSPGARPRSPPGPSPSRCSPRPAQCGVPTVNDLRT